MRVWICAAFAAVVATFVAVSVAQAFAGAAARLGGF